MGGIGEIFHTLYVYHYFDFPFTKLFLCLIFVSLNTFCIFKGLLSIAGYPLMSSLPELILFCLKFIWFLICANKKSEHSKKKKKKKKKSIQKKKKKKKKKS